MRKIIALLSLASLAFASELSFTTLQSDFSQIVTSEGQSINYEGKFYAKDDNTALWIYESPTPKQIYFNGERVIVVEDELEQAIISRLEDTPNLTKILAEAKEIEAGHYKATYDDVDYLITMKGDIPSVIDYKDKLGNAIKVTLKNPVKNAAISQEILTPKIPEGYDIINQ